MKRRMASCTLEFFVGQMDGFPCLALDRFIDHVSEHGAGRYQPLLTIQLWRPWWSLPAGLKVVYGNFESHIVATDQGDTILGVAPGFVQRDVGIRFDTRGCRSCLPLLVIGSVRAGGSNRCGHRIAAEL